LSSVSVEGLVDLASATGQGVLVWDSDLRLVGVNPLALVRLSLAPDALSLGNRFVDVMALIDARAAADLPAERFADLAATIGEGRGRIVATPDPARPAVRVALSVLGGDHVAALIDEMAAGECDGPAGAAGLDTFRTTFETLSDGVMILDAQHRIVHCNRSYLAIFHVDPQRFALGMTVTDFANLHGDLADLPEHERNLAAEIRARFARGQNGASAHATVERTLRTGEIIEVRRTRLLDGGAVLIARDISSQVELSRQKSSLETMLNNLSDGVMMIDAQHKVTAYSPRVLDLYDIDGARVGPGMHVRDFIAAQRDLDGLDKRECAVQINERLMAVMDGGIATGSVRLERETSTGRVLDITRSRLEKGGAVITIRDATEEHALARKQQQLETIVEHIDEAIVLIDAKGTVEIANKQMHDFHAIPRAVAPQGMPYRDFVKTFGDYATRSGKARAEFVRDELGFLADPAPAVQSAVRKAHDGRYLKTTRVPLPRGGFIATSRDVTAELERERLLEQAKAEAEETSRMKSDFLARVTHELRTPMHGVLGMAALLARTGLSDNQDRLLDVLSKSGRHMLDLIDGLLTISTMETGDLVLEAEPLDLSETIVHCVEMIRPRAAEKGLDVLMTGDLPSGKIALGDEMRLKQILTNLMTNAVKFTERGRITIQAEALTGSERTFLRVSVADTGPGIAEDELATIFEKFAQLKRSEQRPQEGVGLGLAIAKSLSELMAGRLDVESTVGRGSIFTLTVPLERAHALPAAKSA